MLPGLCLLDCRASEISGVLDLLLLRPTSEVLDVLLLLNRGLVGY